MSERPVRWARRALDDFDEAVGYLRQRDARIAERYLRAVEETVVGLSRRNTGRPSRLSGIFEKSMPRFSYVIAFMYQSDVLHVLRIVHTARDWPADGWPKD